MGSTLGVVACVEVHVLQSMHCNGTRCVRSESAVRVRLVRCAEPGGWCSTRSSREGTIAIDVALLRGKLSGALYCDGSYTLQR